MKYSAEELLELQKKECSILEDIDAFFSEYGFVNE